MWLKAPQIYLISTNIHNEQSSGSHLVCKVPYSWGPLRLRQWFLRELNQVPTHHSLHNGVSVCLLPKKAKMTFKYSPVCAVLTTSVCGRSKTLTPLMVKMMSPTSKPLDSAGVFGSMADTTTGREPWIRKPNSPRTLSTRTNLLHSATFSRKKSQFTILQ